MRTVSFAETFHVEHCLDFTSQAERENRIQEKHKKKTCLYKKHKRGKPGVGKGGLDYVNHPTCKPFLARDDQKSRVLMASISHFVA
jgi:hypothetical protein